MARGIHLVGRPGASGMALAVGGRAGIRRSNHALRSRAYRGVKAPTTRGHATFAGRYISDANALVYALIGTNVAVFLGWHTYVLWW